MADLGNEHSEHLLSSRCGKLGRRRNPSDRAVPIGGGGAVVCYKAAADV